MKYFLNILIIKKGIIYTQNVEVNLTRAQHVASQNTEIIVINQSFAKNYMGLHTLNVLSVRRHCNPYELFL